VASVNTSVVLAGAVVAAALFAALRTQTPRPAPISNDPPSTAEPAGLSDDDPQGEVLPPNHPDIGGPGASRGMQGQDPDQAPAIIWKVPAKWTVVPNPNTMRLATYHVPAAAGAPDEAEVSVTRAGGSTEANVQRWIGQFADAGPDKRTEKNVHGLKVSMVEVSGTFQAGGMTPEAKGPRRGWSLRGAVVETADGAYFLKMTGPSASIRAARADFDALIESIAPAEGSSPL